MKFFTNKNVIACKNRNIFLICFGVLFIVLTVILLMLSGKQDKADSDNIKYLNEVIEGSDEKTDLKAYLNISWLSSKVAVYNDTSDAYYFAYDGKYYYIVYMKEKKANELRNMNLEENPVRIEGITKDISLDVKNIAIDVYNDGLDESKEKLTLINFYNMFGDVYLDQTVSFTGAASTYNVFAVFSGFIGLILTVVGVVKFLLFKSSVSKMSDSDVYDLESEMSSDDAFYYSKNKLYLTRNYIIMLDGRFKYYKYSDILWMYPFEQRYNGLRTNKAIKILTRDGKTTMFANVSVATKTMKAVYDEIWGTIIEKNPSVKLGYSSENIKYFNDVIKEIKHNKKNGI